VLSMGSWDDETSRSLMGFDLPPCWVGKLGCLGCCNCGGGASESVCEMRMLGHGCTVVSSSGGHSAGFQCCEHPTPVA